MNEKEKETAAVETTPKNTRREVTPYTFAVEDEQGYTVKIELPGVQESDIELGVENRTLSVTAENELGEFPKYELVLNEVPEVRYRTAFALPQEVDDTKITATLKHGVLTLTLPKREEVKPHKIEIAIGE